MLVADAEVDIFAVAGVDAAGKWELLQVCALVGKGSNDVAVAIAVEEGLEVGVRGGDLLEAVGFGEAVGKLEEVVADDVAGAGVTIEAFTHETNEVAAFLVYVAFAEVPAGGLGGLFDEGCEITVDAVVGVNADDVAGVKGTGVNEAEGNLAGAIEVAVLPVVFKGGKFAFEIGDLGMGKADFWTIVADDKYVKVLVGLVADGFEAAFKEGGD